MVGSLNARKGTSNYSKRSSHSSSSSCCLLLVNVVWISGLASLFTNRLKHSNVYPHTLVNGTGSEVSLTGSFINCANAVVDDNGQFQEDFHDGSVTISCRRFHYKVPITELMALQGSNLIIGVLSGSDMTRRRTIRETWKQLAPSSVFFVVSGDFANIEEEYKEYNDIMWLDEADHHIDDGTYKTQFLFQIVNTYTTDFNFLLKTEDDCFVNITKFDTNQDEYIISNFWGICNHDNSKIHRPGASYMPGNKEEVTYDQYPSLYFPPFCSGAGYLVSSEFLNCAVIEMPNLRYFKFDDVSTGMLAERCHIEPVDAGHDKIHAFSSAKPMHKVLEDLWIEQTTFSVSHMVRRWNGTVI